MEYIIEAKKFIQRAKNDENEEVRNTDLDMAEWLLTRALAKRLVAQRLWPGLRTR
jgi:hypothetical protein